jgi:hypothetical protein
LAEVGPHKSDFGESRSGRLAAKTAPRMRSLRDKLSGFRKNARWKDYHLLDLLINLSYERKLMKPDLNEAEKLAKEKGIKWPEWLKNEPH